MFASIIIIENLYNNIIMVVYSWGNTCWEKFSSILPPPPPPFMIREDMVKYTNILTKMSQQTSEVVTLIIWYGYQVKELSILFSNQWSSVSQLLDTNLRSIQFWPYIYLILYAGCHVIVVSCPDSYTKESGEMCSQRWYSACYGMCIQSKPKYRYVCHLCTSAWSSDSGRPIFRLDIAKWQR